MYGTFSVLLEAVETRLHVARDASSLGMALAILGIALTSPLAGWLAAKTSLRTLMMVGQTMQVIAYTICRARRIRPDAAHRGGRER